MATLEERLNERINELENELEKKLRAENDAKYVDSWRWRDIRKVSITENNGLPIPRLELRWRALDGDNAICDYLLVQRHYLGHLIATPLSSTKVGGGGSREYCARLDTPFRDGAHIKHDAAHFKLPAFVCFEAQHRELEPLTPERMAELERSPL